MAFKVPLHSSKHFPRLWILVGRYYHALTVTASVWYQKKCLTSLSPNHIIFVTQHVAITTTLILDLNTDQNISCQVRHSAVF